MLATYQGVFVSVCVCQAQLWRLAPSPSISRSLSMFQGGREEEADSQEGERTEKEGRRSSPTGSWSCTSFLVVGRREDKARSAEGEGWRSR